MTNMEEVKKFIDNLKDERNEVSLKLRFVSEHKFEREADYLRNKVQIINTIMYELESVVEGKTKGNEASFPWLGC